MSQTHPNLIQPLPLWLSHVPPTFTFLSVPSHYRNWRPWHLKWKGVSPSQDLHSPSYHECPTYSQHWIIRTAIPPRSLLSLSSLNPLSLCSYTIIPIPHHVVAQPFLFIYSNSLQACIIMVWSVFVKLHKSKCIFNWLGKGLLRVCVIEMFKLQSADWVIKINILTNNADGWSHASQIRIYKWSYTSRNCTFPQ